MRPRRAQESQGVAQNSPGANSKPEEMPKSLHVRMRARDASANSTPCSSSGHEEEVPKKPLVRMRARDFIKETVQRES